MGKSLLYEVAEGVGTIRLHRPEVLNALHGELAADLAEAAERAARVPAVGGVVVRGAGRAFSSGMDRTALAAGQIGEAFYRHWIRALNCLEDMDKLSVAVLHGYAIGGGLQLACACDVRLASTDAVLGLGATRHGLIPDGSILRLARIVGLGRAKELTLLNDNVTPAAALAMGLVNWVVPPGEIDATLAGIAEKAFHASRTATGHAKRLLHESFHRDPRAMIEDVMRAQVDCMGSWEIEEANRAWDDGREARFYPPPAGR
ncbi:MAG: enoyl-CoA hydratase/isomerase family protein [Candidatus Rokubacteria bacterium]|nr:enoyl-CoA hydratase/isomerase family protein [Candidatus Rokubacteria bacterium]